MFLLKISSKKKSKLKIILKSRIRHDSFVAFLGDTICSTKINLLATDYDSYYSLRVGQLGIYIKHQLH